MEIVIKISDEDYEYLKTHNKHGLYSSILNGTPLPKGHGALIDVDDLREDFKASKKISFAERMDISCIVDHADTIIEADKETTDEIDN